MKTIAIINQKGGVAKTVTAVNLAADLAQLHGLRVLLIDADSQANSTEFFRAGEDEPKRTLADLLRIPPFARTKFTVSFDLLTVIQPSRFPGVDLLPADSSLMDLDLSKVTDETAYVQVLADGLPDLDGRYDAVLIDCPPAFNAASAAALLAADEVLVPIKMDAFSLRGMGNLIRQISNMRAINPKLELLGLLPTMWYASPQIHEAERLLRESGLPVLPRIRRSAMVDDMTFRQEPLITSSPKSGACVDYKRLAARLADRLNGVKRGGVVNG